MRAVAEQAELQYFLMNAGWRQSHAVAQVRARNYFFAVALLQLNSTASTEVTCPEVRPSAMPRYLHWWLPR
jgi:hypothetical protein